MRKSKNAYWNVFSHEAFKGIPKNLKDEIYKRFKNVFTHKPKVAVLGKTGVGKSTLINALFGCKVTETSAVQACTRGVSQHDLGDIILFDVPGIGETQSKDAEYIPLYQSLFTESDLVIWLIKSDDRAYAEIQNILAKNNSETPIIFALSNADKISPIKGWNWDKMEPSPEQERNLKLKEHEVSKELNIPTNKIVAISCDDTDETQTYNLKVLLEKITNLLPDAKKASFYKAASKNAKSDKSRKIAEKGTLDYIFENLGKIVAPFVPVVAKLVAEALTEKDSFKKILDTGLKLFKKISKQYSPPLSYG